MRLLNASWMCSGKFCRKKLRKKGKILKLFVKEKKEDVKWRSAKGGHLEAKGHPEVKGQEDSEDWEKDEAEELEKHEETNFIVTGRKSPSCRDQEYREEMYSHLEDIRIEDSGLGSASERTTISEDREDSPAAGRRGGLSVIERARRLQGKIDQVRSLICGNPSIRVQWFVVLCLSIWVQ